MRTLHRSAAAVAALAFLTGGLGGQAVSSAAQDEIDRKVAVFLESHKYQWRSENVAEEDGRVLFDLIVQNGYTHALDIGTSTGHSAIWIAWALSKTGGRLITVEIEESRHQKALVNFERAGLSDFIDARLADAHELVPRLEGPFDFVFIDADKNWYTRYVDAVLPKLKPGGVITARNVRSLLYMRGIREFLRHVRDIPELETIIDERSSSGILISTKR
jgi:predicted O-methyltransferase YrrM